MTRRLIKIHFVYNLICVIIALAAFIYLSIFNFKYAALWSFLAGVFSCANAHLHLLYIVDKLAAWYNSSTLSGIRCLAYSATVLFLAFLIWYLFNLFYIVIPEMHSPGDTGVLQLQQTIIWCSVSIVATSSLIWASIKYSYILFEVERQPLLP